MDEGATLGSIEAVGFKDEVGEACAVADNTEAGGEAAASWAVLDAGGETAPTIGVVTTTVAVSPLLHGGPAGFVDNAQAAGFENYEDFMERCRQNLQGTSPELEECIVALATPSAGEDHAELDAGCWQVLDEYGFEEAPLVEVAICIQHLEADADTDLG